MLPEKNFQPITTEQAEQELGFKQLDEATYRLLSTVVRITNDAMIIEQPNGLTFTVLPNSYQEIGLGNYRYHATNGQLIIEKLQESPENQDTVV